MASDLPEAAEYVDLVMTTPSVTRVPVPVVATPTATDDQGRKRSRSGEEAGSSQAKKAKEGHDGSGGNDSSDTSLMNENQMVTLLMQISVDVRNMYERLSARMDSLETNLEKKLYTKLTQAVDKRVTTEANKLRREMDTKVDSLRSDFLEDVNDLQAQVESLGQSVVNQTKSTDIGLNVVIRNLQQGNNENLTSKVNGLFKDGLKIRDVVVKSAERKESYSSKPGVVIASLKSGADKKKVMTSKPNLKDSRVYKDVFISHDVSREERLMTANFRVIVDAVRARNTGVSIRGSRVVTDSVDRADRRNSDTRIDSNTRTERRPYDFSRDQRDSHRQGQGQGQGQGQTYRRSHDRNNRNDRSSEPRRR